MTGHPLMDEVNRQSALLDEWAAAERRVADAASEIRDAELDRARAAFETALVAAGLLVVLPLLLYGMWLLAG